MSPQGLTLRQLVSRFPCLCCDLPYDARERMQWIIENLDIAPKISDPHHLTTVARGGQDTPENLAPFCRKHHDEWHDHPEGPRYLISRYPRLRDWLELAGRTDLLEK